MSACRPGRQHTFWLWPFDADTDQSAFIVTELGTDALEGTESITDLERRVALYQIISHVSADLIKQCAGKKISFEGIRRLTGTSSIAPDPVIIIGAVAIACCRYAGPCAATGRKETGSSRLQDHFNGGCPEYAPERIERALSTSFNAVRVASPDMDEHSQKVYTIVSFLGMLELVRRGLIAANQNELFEDISLSKNAEKMTDHE